VHPGIDREHPIDYLGVGEPFSPLHDFLLFLGRSSCQNFNEKKE
jgi:hypothetical protein